MFSFPNSQYLLAASSTAFCPVLCFNFLMFHKAHKTHKTGSLIEKTSDLYVQTQAPFLIKWWGLKKEATRLLKRTPNNAKFPPSVLEYRIIFFIIIISAHEVRSSLLEDFLNRTIVDFTSSSLNSIKGFKKPSQNAPGDECER